MAKQTVSNRKSHSNVAKGESQISDTEANKILKDFRGRKRLMTKRRMFEYEDSIRSSNRSDNFGVARRMALAVLTRPCNVLMRDIENNRDGALALAHASDAIAEYTKLLKELSELLDEAQRRLIVAICARPDSHELFEEAKRSNNEANRSSGDAHEATHLQ